MKVFLNRSMRTAHGDVIRDSNAKDAPETLLGTYCAEALLRDLPADQAAGGKFKLDRWELAKKIGRAMRTQKGKGYAIDISAEHVALIKTRFAEFAPTTLYGPFCDALEDNDIQDAPGNTA